MIYLALFLFGAMMGSFLNVIAMRWDLPNRVGKIIVGRSACPKCEVRLRWSELIPLFSFILQKGRCRKCKANISWQYPIVEIWTALIFVSIFAVTGFSIYFFLLIFIFCIYVVIAIYDFKHKIIPDELAYSAILLAILFAFISYQSGSNDYGFWDWFAGPVIFLFFWSIWFFSNGRMMGFGDAKLGLSIGLLLGVVQGFSAFVLTFCLGLISVLLYMFLSKVLFLKGAKNIKMKTEIPLGPFMILATWITLIFDLNLTNVSLF